jgi:hypothetical protein
LALPNVLRVFVYPAMIPGIFLEMPIGPQREIVGYVPAKAGWGPFVWFISKEWRRFDVNTARLYD